MDEMGRRIFSIGKIVLSVATIPLWFVKMFADVGHLPDQVTGEIVEVVFCHSMLENVGALAHPILAYIAMAIALISAILNTLVLKLHNKPMRITANIVFWISIGVFLILLLFASTVARGY